jgi:hypothetical protein
LYYDLFYLTIIFNFFIHRILRNLLTNVKILNDFPDMLLLLIANLIPWWSQNMFYVYDLEYCVGASVSMCACKECLLWYGQVSCLLIVNLVELLSHIVQVSVYLVIIYLFYQSLREGVEIFSCCYGYFHFLCAVLWVFTSCILKLYFLGT